ncbi:MAG: DUF3667 domain-containing protein, partial [Cryomorphaceae bacterium]|nr:DUF3667 domain-containing protein [Cryomorphaceae bacterium]
MTSCKSCGNSFAGNFCNQCGERVVSDNDFSLKSLLSQALGAIASIDSKWLQTLKFLLFYPGELTAKHVQGVRVNYMRPFQILIVSNIIFYLFLSETDLFRTPSQWFFVENFDGISVMKKVRKISAANDLDINEIAILYDNKSSNLAKGLIFCLIPLFALVGKLLNPNRGFAFGKHLVFATHYLSFVLLLVVLFGETLLLLPIAANRWLLIIPTVIIMMLYYSIGLKR